MCNSCAFIQRDWPKENITLANSDVSLNKLDAQKILSPVHSAMDWVLGLRQKFNHGYIMRVSHN